MNKLFRKYIINPKEIIVEQAKREGNIIYGSTALKKQVSHGFARMAQDCDVLADNPKESAEKAANKLNNDAGYDSYAVVKGKNYSTYKVIDKELGFNVADFSRKKDLVTKNIDGVEYADLSEIKKDKLNSIKNPEFRFRHLKDFFDVKIMEESESIKAWRLHGK